MAVAHARAYHQIAEEPRVFTDPFAIPILGESVMTETYVDHGLDPELVRHRRLFIAARSRFADDTVAAAIVRGTDQVVILGAGLDTTAYRHSNTNVQFYEVDHPTTQEWKRRRLSQAGIAIPDALTFVPADFENTTLAAGLAGAGLDSNRSAVYVWLGVAVYLTRASVDGTLRYIASHGKSELVFDYFYPIAATPHDPTAAQLQARANRVAEAGEPWLTFFTSDEVRDSLVSVGYSRVEDRSATELLTFYGVPTDAPASNAGPHLVHCGTA
ncbi:class I SAM-dependent methyltransferase [Nocardia amamiensis]|uniref:S-adenosyl-L-methionine-dependent methyltransferase n=1 Tax=Nocardia amamiensis TaxID=404578 RepID=A0ABS0D0V1_9NOCA|nr:SAM-dependent methyltransferase [Nocardia amamiensis]MBF6302470.1 class I SAM-dependent methyltransferase [Nocardia amamiensis]